MLTESAHELIRQERARIMGSEPIHGLERACEAAGVIALPWPELSLLMANSEAVRRVMTGEVEDGRA